MMIATVGAQRRKCVQHVLEVARVLVVDRGVPAVVVAGELVAHVFDAKLDRVVVGRLSAWMVRVVCGRVAGPGPGPAAAAAVRRATGGSSMGGARTGTAASSCTSDGAARINTHVPPTPASSNDNTKHDTLPTQNLPHLTDPRFVVSTSTPDVNGPLPSSAQPIVTQRASKVDLVERSCQMIDLTQLGSDPAQSPTDTLHDSGASVGGRYRNTISAVNGRSVSHKSGHHGETRAERREEEEDGIEWKRRGTAPVMKGASRRASQAE
ncbi:hypothetical protein BCR44DRAFT_1440443 [Catenaria anguillulae PL171]|uniref:Uncharacterized protein n=1 Tax=Catenaria anguillulae PL171 TaxID=765915 RepID=A0A1Y2HEZ4_9FUNG|nr:hypothetical protein BCR44DRAFT_1440443 [Catenaria anguillulae PL171]